MHPSLFWFLVSAKNVNKDVKSARRAPNPLFMIRFRLEFFSLNHCLTHVIGSKDWNVSCQGYWVKWLGSFWKRFGWKCKRIVCLSGNRTNSLKVTEIFNRQIFGNWPLRYLTHCNHAGQTIEYSIFWILIAIPCSDPKSDDFLFLRLFRVCRSWSNWWRSFWCLPRMKIKGVPRKDSHGQMGRSGDF